MNIHHLELFYYVARHGGISRAVRHMPYGIQQPAVSGQMLQLEQDLGLKLFVRTPFSLTPAGAELYAFVEPFFGNLGAVEAKLRGHASPLLRVGASEIVLRDHFPKIVEPLRRRFRNLRLTLRSGFQPDFEAWLENREIDVAITPLEKRPPARLRCLRLRKLPLVLLVHRKSGIRSAEEIWGQDRIETPLISLPATESICRLFRQGLKRWRVDWPPGVVTSSLELVTHYVANGYGIGLGVNEPAIVRHRDVRVLELRGFDPIEMVALWVGKPSALVGALLAEAKRYAAEGP
ncbi:MAG TPA: LysR family transcriptional regulator [Verrucomicrobiae bacterium]|nr:LysR family transcriptional regulator [Verrucomicrobiae bacterium]